jgi:uncharacterized protein YktA (UPF0223 family)
MSHYRIYIDESCHLEHDRSDVMAIGYIKANIDHIESLKNGIKDIKKKHGVLHELKWNTISNTKVSMYKELIDFFFENPIDFRCLLVKYKKRLNHDAFNMGDHDNFYYKMVYYLLSNDRINPKTDEYHVFLDIKDTKGKQKLNKIQEVFRNKDHGSTAFKSFQHIRSHEVQFIQLADIFIGAITYKARGLHLIEGGSVAKKDIVRYIEQRSGYVIDEGTEPWETKFNIFDHQPRIRV